MTNPIDNPRLQAAADQLSASLEPFGEAVGLLDAPFDAHTEALTGLQMSLRSGGPAARAAFDQVTATGDLFDRAIRNLSERFEEHCDALVGLHRAVFDDPPPAEPGRGVLDASGLDPEAFAGRFWDLLDAVLRDDEDHEAAREIAWQGVADLRGDDEAHRIMWQLLAMTVTRAWAAETGQSPAEVVAKARQVGR